MPREEKPPTLLERLRAIRLSSQGSIAQMRLSAELSNFAEEAARRTAKTRAVRAAVSQLSRVLLFKPGEHEQDFSSLHADVVARMAELAVASRSRLAQRAAGAAILRFASRQGLSPTALEHLRDHLTVLDHPGAAEIEDRIKRQFAEARALADRTVERGAVLERANRRFLGLLWTHNRRRALDSLLSLTSDERKHEYFNLTGSLLLRATGISAYIGWPFTLLVNPHDAEEAIRHFSEAGFEMQSRRRLESDVELSFRPSPFLGGFLSGENLRRLKEMSQRPPFQEGLKPT